MEDGVGRGQGLRARPTQEAAGVPLDCKRGPGPLRRRLGAGTIGEGYMFRFGLGVGLPGTIYFLLPRTKFLQPFVELDLGLNVAWCLRYLSVKRLSVRFFWFGVRVRVGASFSPPTKEIRFAPENNLPNPKPIISNFVHHKTLPKKQTMKYIYICIYICCLYT